MSTRRFIPFLCEGLAALWALSHGHGAIVSEWTGNAAQNWSTATWSAGMPDGPGDTANLTYNITAARTLTIDSTSRRVGILNIGDSAPPLFTVTLASSGGARLLFDNAGNPAQLTQMAISSNNVVSAPLTLLDDLIISNQSAYVLTISGAISNPAALTRRIWNSGHGSGEVIISGVISNGPASFEIIQASATSPLALTAANTFTGRVIVTAGFLAARGNNNALGLGTAVDTVTLEGGKLNFNDSASRTFARNIQVNQDAEVIVQRNAVGAGLTYTLGQLTIGPQRLTVSGGNINSGTTVLQFSSAVFSNSPVFEVINPVAGGLTQLTFGGVTNNGFTPLFLGNGQVTQTAPWTGAGGLILGESFTGVVILSTLNTYQGPTIVSNGALRITTNNAMPAGSTAGDLFLSGTLDLRAAQVLNGLWGTGRVDNLTTTPRILTVGTNNASCQFDGFMTNSGAIASLEVVKIGQGRWTLTGAQGFGSNLTVRAGAVRILHGQALGLTNGSTVVTAGGTLEIAGGITVAGEPLSLSGAGWNTNGALQSLWGDNTWDGLVTLAAACRIQCDSNRLTIAGPILGTAPLTLGGEGEVRLTGTNSYTNGTWVDGGTLRVDGLLDAAAGPVIVTNGAVLTGTGTLQRPVRIASGSGTRAGGHLGAGSPETPGTLTIAHNLEIAPGSSEADRPILTFRVAPQGNDRVEVQGNLTIPAGGRIGLELNRLNGGWVNGRSFTLLTWKGTDPAVEADDFDLILTEPTWSGGQVIVDKTANEIRVAGLQDSVINIGVTNLTDTTADLVGELLATSASPTEVWAFWDTEDHGTNKSWTHAAHAVAPALGLLINTATGLSPNTSYFFT